MDCRPRERHENAAPVLSNAACAVRTHTGFYEVGRTGQPRVPPRPGTQVVTIAGCAIVIESSVTVASPALMPSVSSSGSSSPSSRIDTLIVRIFVASRGAGYLPRLFSLRRYARSAIPCRGFD